MNIWALAKDVSIKYLLLLLTEYFGDNVFEVIIAEQDDRAVRLRKLDDSTLSVYIYTYGQQQDYYGVHLEYPDLLETSLNNTLDIYDNVDFEKLCYLLQTHLDLNPTEL